MKKTHIFYLVIPVLFFGVLGCAPLIIGAVAGSLGAYAVSKDTIQTETDKPYDNLWNAVLTVSRIRGTVKEQDSSRGYVELETESSRVWIRLVRLTHATTRLKVSARKYHMPNMSLAEDIFAKIMEEAK